MAQTPLETRPSALESLLVKLEFGSSVVRLARYTEDIVVSGDGTYASEPTLEVSHGQASMFLEDNSCTITCRDDLEPFKSAASGRVHAPIKATCWRVNPLDSTDRKMIFSHNIDTVVKRPGGTINLVSLNTKSLKSSLERTIHLTTNPVCEHVFGMGFTRSLSIGCQFNLESTKALVTVDAIGDPTPTTIRVTTDNSPDYSNPDRWENGQAIFEGLSIRVRRYRDISGTDYFELSKIPPQSWLDEQIIVYMGCDHTLERCTLHGQTQRRLAPGEAIPDYHPVAETSD